MMMVDKLFPVCDGSAWRRSIARGRARENKIAAQIRQKLAAASGGVVVNEASGLSSAAGQPPLARGIISPTAPLELCAVNADEVRVPVQGAAGVSSAVSSATAGRDRRNFS